MTFFGVEKSESYENRAFLYKKALTPTTKPRHTSSTFGPPTLIALQQQNNNNKKKTTHTHTHMTALAISQALPSCLIGNECRIGMQMINDIIGGNDAFQKGETVKQLPIVQVIDKRADANGVFGLEQIRHGRVIHNDCSFNRPA